MGKWIIVDDTEYFIAKCSECGKKVDSRILHYNPDKFLFCPKCKTRMENTAGRNSISEEKKEKCRWIKYDYRTICPEKHDIDNPYWRIPENYKDALKYCPYCGKEIEYSWERDEDDRENELKPCKCGSAVELCRDDDDYYIYCPKCKLKTFLDRVYDNITDNCDRLIDVWNGRDSDGRK